MLSVIIILVVNVLVVGFIPALKHGAFSLIFRNQIFHVTMRVDLMYLILFISADIFYTI